MLLVSIATNVARCLDLLPVAASGGLNAQLRFGRCAEFVHAFASGFGHAV